MVAMTRTKLIGARDPNGIRPLVLGDLDGKPIFCSETCALDIIGAKFVRDVENGEVVICEIQPDGSITIDSRKPFAPKPERLCLFEYVYFARPDSVVGGRSVYVGAQAHGHQPRRTKRRSRPMSSCRCPMAARRRRSAMRRRAAFPFELGIIRNHYVGRTFIEPTQSIRAFGVKLKHSANRAEIDGKRVVLIDDFDRARHDLGQDRADDARGRRHARCTSASPPR